MNKKISKLSFFGIAVLAILFAVGVSSAWADSRQLLSVNDLPANSPDQITLDSVRSDGAGWVAIFNQTADLKPGYIICYAPLHDGLNYYVTVKFDASEATTQM